MKKNVMLKIASVLMIAVLLTTCAISSTFAKYVDTGVDLKTNTARVAKWGIHIGGTTNNDVPLFLRTYDVGETATVEGAATDDIVVAPGTSNSTDAFKITVTGTPEVAYRLYATADIELANWTVEGGAYYCPLAITVDGTTYYGNADGITSEDDFEAVIENAIINAILAPGTDEVLQKDAQGKFYKDFAPNTSVPASANEVSVSWAWAFEKDTDAKQDDTKDTFLGNAAADGTKTTINISFSVSAEQIGD